MNLMFRLLVISFCLAMVTACSEQRASSEYSDTEYAGNDQEADYSGSYFDASVDVFLEPQLQLTSRGPVVPPHNLSLPISTINISEVELELFYVHKPGAYLSKHKHYIDKNISSWDLNRQNEALSSVYLERYRIENVSTNEDIRSRIALPRNLKEGWYFARMRQVGVVDDYMTFPLHITSLGAHLSYLPGETTAELFVNDIQSGQPLESGSVQTYLNGRLVGVKYPIEGGKAKVKINHDDRYTIVASSSDGQNVSIISPKEVPLDLSEFNIDGKPYTPVDAFIYGNRDLLKPSESLLVSVLVRDDDGQNIESVPLYLRLIKPDGQTEKIKLQPGENKGHYRHAIDVPQDAPTGLYKLEARVNPYAENPMNTFLFQVQEFTPERMDMHIELALSNSQVHQRNHLSLEGRYLFGAPANGNKADVTITSKAVRFPSKRLRNYIVGAPFDLEKRYQQLPELTLDSKGTGNIALPRMKEQLMSPVESTISVVLKDKGATGAQRKVRYITHPSNKYVAVKELSETPSYYSNVDFDLAIIDIEQDKKIDGKLKAALYRHIGSYFWTYSEQSGWQRHDQANPWRLEQEYSVDTSKNTMISMPVKWGRYKLVGKSIDTQTLEYEFRAGWNSSDSLAGVRPGMLNLSYAKDQVNENDQNVTVSFTPNVDGHAIVNLVADKVLWSKSIETKIGELSSLDIPNKWKRHDLYVSVVNVGSDAQENSKRELGVKYLKLNRDFRKLTVTSKLPDKIVPNTVVSFPVEISSLNYAHQGAKLTVSIVDKGITNITDYHGTDPFEHFYAQRSYGFDHIDLYGRIFDQAADPFATPKFGGDAPGAKNNAANELVESKTIILDSQVIQADIQGKAEVSFE
ncbi:MG2 domain-containing protein, partial [Oleiphilus sp. HI0080]|uniref:MG2 domain-containing protein n=1 Tax=Oleiphilus sp. HI0080 TaxID=1822255 RepID=UPI000A83E1D4